jgi:hypothetical protein
MRAEGILRRFWRKVILLHAIELEFKLGNCISQELDPTTELH